MIAEDFVPSWARGDFDYYRLTVCRSITSMGAQKGAVCRQSFTIAGSLDYDLVAGVGQAIQGAIAKDGVVKDD